MTLLELRAQLEAVLSGSIGTYTLPNGSTTPAIAARSEGEDLSTGTQVTGLEVVILRDPVPLPLLQYTDAGTLYTWTVFLIDWSGDADVADVGAHLVNAFPGTGLAPEPVAKGGGPYARLRVTIRSNATSFAPYAPAYRGIPLPSSFVIASPTAPSERTLLLTTTPVSLTGANAVMQGTGSVTFALRYATSRDAIGTLATVSTTITSTTTGTALTIGTMPIPADNYLWIDITATTGTPTELSLSLTT